MESMKFPFTKRTVLEMWGDSNFSYAYRAPGCHDHPLVGAHFLFLVLKLSLKHLVKELIGGHVNHLD